MATPSVHQLKISLRWTEPAIWRRIEVPSDFDLAQLHAVIQVAFGWEFSHLWSFETPQGRFGDEWAEDEPSAKSVTLTQVAPRRDGRFSYTYDFGDSWEHEIRVEAVSPGDPSVAYPRCTDGRLAGPPEDCGGVPGYEELLRILADPDDEEHQDRVEWLGLNTASEFDPAAFDLEEINRALRRSSSSR